MNWNISSTATVSGDITIDDDGVLRVSAGAIEKYLDAEGVLKRKNLLFFLSYRGRNLEDVAGRLVPNTRIAFEGFFNGPSMVKNEAYPKSLTVNGPQIYYAPEGDPFCALNVSATNLRIIGDPVKKIGEDEDFTTVVLWGFLGRDAEQQYTASGKLVTRASIASNRFYYLGDGDEREKYDVTTWWRCTLWGDGGINAINYWKKGTALIFKGSPNVDNVTGAPKIWQTSDGMDRASYEMTVHVWTFAPAKRGSAGPSANDSDYQAPVSEDIDTEIPF